MLHSNYDGIYLADPAFEPLWEELNRRSAVVFIHPTTPKGVNVLPGVPGPLEDYPAETTRAALDLVIASHLTRFSATKIILSHGGGFLPYAATRFAELKSSLAPDRTAAELTIRTRQNRSQRTSREIWITTMNSKRVSSMRLTRAPDLCSRDYRSRGKRRGLRSPVRPRRNAACLT